MANSKVLVKNDKVIVTEWSFDIGDSTGHHIHQYNYVAVSYTHLTLPTNREV